MSDFTNVLDVSYGAYVVNGAYGGVNKSSGDLTQAPSRDSALEIIRDLFGDDIAATWQSVRDAGTAVSITHIFTDAIETIAEKLVRILELDKKAPSPDYSHGQVEEIQTPFQNLSKEIKQTGNGSKIDIFA